MVTASTPAFTGVTESNAVEASKVTSLVILRKLKSVPTLLMALSATDTPSTSTPPEMNVPALLILLSLIVAVDDPVMSRLTAVRVDCVVLPSTVSATPPPSNQMPRPHAAVEKAPFEVPEIRLSVMLIAPLPMTEVEIARSSTPLAPPATVDQKIELVTL